MKIAKNNLGKQIEEMMKLKNKAEFEAKKSENAYVQEALNTGKQLLKQLDVALSNPDVSDLEKANAIFTILVSKFDNSIEQAKDKYEFWADLDNKFNS